MVNKMKDLERKRAMLRNRQNPSVIDYRLMRRARTLKSKYWKLRKVKAERKVPEVPSSEKKEVEKEPELEVIDE
jgi:hypothetical protein